MHVIAAKAVAFGEALRPEFVTYQQQVIDNAQAMAGALMERGYPLVSGGTDNHLMLIDLREAPVSGKEAEALLGAAGITVNKNTVPGETRSPMVTSGVRVGTPAMTTRGMGAAESRQVLLQGDAVKGAVKRRREAPPTRPHSPDLSAPEDPSLPSLPSLPPLPSFAAFSRASRSAFLRASTRSRKAFGSFGTGTEMSPRPESLELVS